MAEKTDKDVMQGDPTETAAEKTAREAVAAAKAAANAPVEVEIAGIKVKMSPADAEKVRADQKKSTDALEAAKADAAAARKAAAKPEPKADPAAKPDPFDGMDVMLFANPKEAAKQIAAAAVAEATQSITATYQQREAQSAFWNEFYSQNKDLADQRLLVDAVFARDYVKLSGMTTADAATKLAEAAKAEYLKIAGRQPGKSGKPDGEGGNNPGKLGSKQGEDADGGKPPVSLSSTLRDRAEARRKAATGQRA